MKPSPGDMRMTGIGGKAAAGVSSDGPQGQRAEDAMFP